MSVPCPDCTKAFDTERGMKIHHGQQHKDGLRPYTCVWCSGWFSKNEHNVGKHPTCSEPCRSAFLSHRRSGENAPNWKGGEDNRGKEWEVLAQFVRQRDGECLNCGRNRTSSGRRLHVHHITARDEIESKEKANKPSNLVSLCFSCHQDFEGVEEKKQLQRLGIASRSELELSDELEKQYEAFRRKMMPKLTAPNRGSREGERCGDG